MSLALGVLLVGLTVSPSMRGMFTRGGSVAAFDESISTFASSDCATPKSSWDLGQTACAVASGAVDERRIAWVTPNGAVAQFSSSFAGTGSDSYSIPTEGSFAQVGTWTVQTIDNSGVGFVSAEFVVRDPANASVDLSIEKYGPFETSADNNINYRVEVINRGPDDAQVVTITDSIPANTTFVSEAQNSGPGFTCVTPTPGSSTGTITCTIATLPANATAVFSLAFNVTAGTPDGAIISNAASISSSTNELNAADNSASTSALVTVASSVCTLNCPSNITQDNDANQCTAVVSYSTPTASGNCGSPPDNAVICNPPSGSIFPIGASAVVCTTQTGGACSFTVTVHDTRPAVQPTITCPSNVSVGEDSPDSGSAVVNYASPVTTGNCVTAVCDPPSGFGFNIGTTTVNCTATDSSNNTVTCSFTVTVTSGAACTLNCPGDVTQMAPANQCNAVVSYPAPSTTGDCGTVTCNPSSGSTFPVGTTTVTCSSSQGPSCDFTVTVAAPAPPTITTCPSNKTVSANALCEGVIPNLLSEVVATGCSVTLSQSPTAGSIVDPGVVTVTITAENSAGEATCTATVTVSETTPPVITSCAAGTSAPADGSCQAPVPNVIGGVTASDNCTPSESLTITQSPAAGTLVGAGTTTITITVKDASNNSTTCTTTFTVNDATPPAISCPANISATAALGQPSTTVTFSPAVTDNCSGASAVCVPPSGSVFQLGVTTVSCTATDPSGNQANCTFKVAVSGTLLATADSFLRDGADNTNEGGNDLLRIQSSGHNRVLARFNASGISTTGLQSATLILNITENSDNWGTTGRLVDANRLLADWTEGNGHTVGDQPNFRGTGEGVTWDCAKDSNIANQNDDCTSQWDGGTFAAPTAASVLHTNNQMGDVSWNVTADMQAGANYGWVVKKQVEGQNGQVRYFSREGSASLGPRLVLVYQP